MTDKPRKQQFVKLPRELLQSSAWRTLGINERRFLDYLMLEDMRRAGRHNGELAAPHRELVKFGIGGRFIASVVSNLVQRGLIKSFRHDAYSPHTYALTWLPCRGTPPTNDWKRYSGKASVLHEGAAREAIGPDVKRCSTTASRRCSTRAEIAESNIVSFQEVARPVLHEGAAVYRQSFHEGEVSKVLDRGIEGDGSTPAADQSPTKAQSAADLPAGKAGAA